ncbi:MAG: HD domain-containing protein [Bdellovibrionales bacterium]|nr:HD domain-containing protein [Bdellovibrionales bacterium]
MAARSFLLEPDRAEGLAILAKAGFPADVRQVREEFSTWLEGKLLQRLNSLGDFHSLQPVLLGSWSRHELTPKSDIDLLFAGPEEQVKEFVAKAFRAGLKLRARTPESAKDWTVGVEPFDILALFNAQALNAKTSELLHAHRRKVIENRRAIFKAIRSEREERRKRQDSITNYLEPNLKFGAGGLRDIEQALALRPLFEKQFANVDPYPFQVLTELKEEFLFLRSYLHLLGSGDILTAHDQLELAKRLNMESPRALMTFIQSELERASFYADWVVANCTASIRARKATVFHSLGDVIQKLKDDPTQLRQFEVRRTVNEWFKPLTAIETGKALHKALYSPVKDGFIVALYRTRLLEGFIPDLKKIRGLVQHDHYHRFTADAHLVQTLREVQRAESFPRTLGPLKVLTKELGAADWWILKLSALFHDLAKGRKGDHSSEGAKLVNKYFEEWQYPEHIKADVHWLVENHLILSTAAFRQNPQAQTTWKRLFERGVEGRRLLLLALFTAIDIRSTNPEAWTDWKAKLLLDLVENLRSPRARSLQAHLKLIAKSPRPRELEKWLLELDPVLLEMISPRVLIEDLQAAHKSKGDLPPKVIATRSRKVWVRFHRKQDETGLFLKLVSQLFGFGLSVQMSSVHTIEGVGVYDWFCLRTEKPARQIAKWMSLTPQQPPKIPTVEWQSIDLMSSDEHEWIFSFRGRDQRGLLLSAAQALHQENLSLRWARAHTWGHQVDDIFSVRPLGEVQALLERLRKRFVT